jgi:uncharacterized protein (AIM24 family)
VRGFEFDMHFRKQLATGIFGGEGFVMERLTDPGLAFLEVHGEA